MTVPVIAANGLPPEALTRMRAALLLELSVQTEQAAECRATTNELTGQTDADSVLEREIAERSTIRAEDAIADIRLALERLDAGTYGTCERCGRAIQVERLEVIPHARQCVACP